MTIQDPRLRAAMHEVQSVLDKWDVMGVVALADGLGHSEFRIALDKPTWSTFRWIDEGKGKVHFKGYAKSKPEETQRSTNALVGLASVTGAIAISLIDLEKRITTIMNTEKEPGKWETRIDDPPEEER